MSDLGIGLTQVPPTSFSFCEDTREVAKMWFDKEEGKLKFIGDMDVAASALFTLVEKQVENYIAAKRKTK